MLPDPGNGAACSLSDSFVNITSVPFLNNELPDLNILTGNSLPVPKKVHNTSIYPNET